MKRMGLSAKGWLVVLGGMWAGPITAQPLTVEQAVQVALQKNTQVIGAEATLQGARGSLYGAYSGVLPNVSASLQRRGSWQDQSSGSSVFGGVVVPGDLRDYEAYSTVPSVGGSWSVVNLAAWNQLSSARKGVDAATHGRSATRQDVAYSTRRQFYEVVKAEHLARVANFAVRLARDDERRVRALFEVGSVSRSDLLKAQVRTAESEFDSLVAGQTVVNQRISLASLMGVRESEMASVDTILTAASQEYDRDTLLSEAERQRPDVMAAASEFAAARASLRAANFLRLPYVSVSGGLAYRPRSSFKQTVYESNGVPLAQPDVISGQNESDLEYSATVSLNWDLFTGFGTEGRISNARARLTRAEEAHAAAKRNLAAEVDQALLTYRAAIEGDRVAHRGFESAVENMKLTQEKYNVGSATILELIDAQVQLQRAASDAVSALAAIRVAEAAINRVRGRAE